MCNLGYTYIAKGKRLYKLTSIFCKVLTKLIFNKYMMQNEKSAGLV